MRLTRRPGRPRNPQLRADWKLSLPAPIAAKADLMLLDPLSQRPKYGARSRLVAALLEQWLASLDGEIAPPIPALSELRLGEEGTAS